MPLTIYDISKKANVSIATVSRVLNGNTNVRESTRQKVMRVIEENDYAPNAFARAMSLHTQKTIGILCADSTDIFLAKAVFYLEQQLQAEGYESILCFTGYNLDIKEHYLRLILSKKVDSIILVGSNFISDTLEKNQYIADASKQVPVMIMNAALDLDNVYSVLCDDHKITCSVTSDLIDHGLHDVVFLYNSDSYSCNRKRTGFLEACLTHSIPDAESHLCYVEASHTDISEIQEVLKEYAATHEPFHAVIASDDVLGVAAIQYAQSMGYRIPEDFQVIGYNNSMLTQCCTPALSSIDNQLEAQTHELVHTLLGVLSGEMMPRITFISGTLTKRQSSSF